METRVAVIYYSSTGNVFGLARAIEEGALAAGAEVRLRKVAELAPEDVIAANPAWLRHSQETRDVPVASLDDLEWANAYVFGTPTRYGTVAAQLKQFIDTTSRLWSEGKLADKVACGFTSSHERHGGQESTLLSLYNVFYHWGAIIVPTGYTDETVFAAGGNPYGVSSVEGGEVGPGIAALAAARFQGRRIVEKADALVRGRAREMTGVL